MLIFHNLGGHVEGAADLRNEGIGLIWDESSKPKIADFKNSIVY